MESKGRIWRKKSALKWIEQMQIFSSSGFVHFGLGTPTTTSGGGIKRKRSNPKSLKNTILQKRCPTSTLGRYILSTWKSADQSVANGLCHTQHTYISLCNTDCIHAVQLCSCYSSFAQFRKCSFILSANSQNSKTIINHLQVMSVHCWTRSTKV